MPIAIRNISGSGHETIQVRLGASAAIGYYLDNSVVPNVYRPLRSNLESLAIAGSDVALCPGNDHTVKRHIRLRPILSLPLSLRTVHHS